jgi:hypothetical protein
MESGLYGIEHSSRNSEQHWTKNCFNSSFPTALANYMMENDFPAIYVKLAVVDGMPAVVCDEIPISEVFNCPSKHAVDLEFDFESIYEPYQQYSFSRIDVIDLVVKDLEGNYLAPVECKLTVLPSSATSKRPEDQWGCEVVYRAPTASYCALSIWDKIKANSVTVRDIFEDACANIGSWTNDFEMCHKTNDLCKAIDAFDVNFCDYQMPLVMQPFWKTKGQSPILDENCFDIVIWSNLAFSRLFVDSASNETSGDLVPAKMSRPMRASARMARSLWELSKSGKIRIEEIYRQMAFNMQTDKEASVPGDRWRRYVNVDRVLHPSLSRDVIEEIVKPGYLEKLKPERRFDQSLYITTLIDD